MRSTSSLAVADRLDRLIGWLYPPRCRFCGDRLPGRDEDCFCIRCLGQIRVVEHPYCTICGRPFLDAGGDDHLCGACLSGPPNFAGARAWACYPREEIAGHPLRVVVHQFKYGRKVSLGKPLGRLMAHASKGFLGECAVDTVLPVPLHPKRLRWRGFNQSVLLAKEVSRAISIPMDSFTLYRVRETAPQTQLDEEKRKKNVRGAFSLRPEKPVKGKRLLLVDDVYTSGATVNECSRILKQAGAREVFVLTLARTVS